MSLTLSEILNREIRILGVIEEEDGAWCAIALETGLRGYGNTFEEAVEDLHEAVRAQVSFNVQDEALDEHNIFQPAEDRYFDLYEKVENESNPPTPSRQAGRVTTRAPLDACLQSGGPGNATA